MSQFSTKDQVYGHTVYLKGCRCDVIVYFLCLPDRPLEGSGSLSDWMGSAGDLSREAASACSHAQLSTHRTARSARGASMPKTSLWSFFFYYYYYSPVSSDNCAKRKEKKRNTVPPYYIHVFPR